jgi:hypothetical protein
MGEGSISMLKKENTPHAPNWWLLITIVCGLQVASIASAGDLTVDDTAAHEGGYGLQVTVGSSCGSDTHLVLDNAGMITLDQEGCDTITAGNNTSVSGTVVFTAGSTVAFGNGFSVNSGSDFTAAIDETLSPFAWVQDDSPTSETTYNAEFYVDADVLSVVGMDEVDHFVAYEDNEPVLKVILQAGPQLVLEAWEDSGSSSSSSAVSLTSGWNQVNITWQSAASATASISVNRGSATSLVGLDTDSLRVTSVRWGAVGGTPDASSGSLFQDDFASWR